MASVLGARVGGGGRYAAAMQIEPRYYGLIEMGLTFGIVLVFTVQQLWSLRDKPPKDDETPPPEG